MKRIQVLTIILFALSYGVLKAQTNKGNILVGASSNIGLAGSGSDLMSIGFSTSKLKSDASGFVQSEPDKSTTINVVPKVGYFVVGLDINLGFSSNSSEDSPVIFTQRIFTVGPFARYYAPESTLLTFLELSGVFGSINNKIDLGGNTNPNISNLTTF